MKEDKVFKNFLKVKHKLRRPVVLVLTGLCGSGKSSLANKLSNKINAKIHTIGGCRNIVKELYDERQPELKFIELNNDTASLLELQAWTLFFYATLREIEKNNDVILDTSGLNKRLSFLLNNLLGIADVIRIKLECPMKELDKRIKNRKEKQNGFFPYEYAGHMELNKDLQRYFKEVKTNITVNTDKLNAEQTYQKVISELKKYDVK